MTTSWVRTKDPRIKKRGDMYWARFMKRGQHVQESLETRSFEIAKRAVENIESDILLGVNWRKERELFETAWPEFLIDKAKGVKTKKAREKTLREYTGFGERFYKPALSDLRLSQINEDCWAELVDKIKSEKPDIQFDNIRKYLMGFLSWAYRKGKIRVKPELFDPDIDRKAERDADGPGLAYTKDELRKMIEGADRRTPQFRLFIFMLVYMGMRPGEVSQLSKDRYDRRHRVIRLRRSDTKTHQPRVVPIHPLVVDQFEAQLERTRSPFLFPNKRDAERPMDPTGFKKHWEAIGLDEGRIYDFRHTFITHAIAAGMNPAKVAKMTGTSLAMIERRYLHFTEKDLTDEINGFEL